LLLFGRQGLKGLDPFSYRGFLLIGQGVPLTKFAAQLIFLGFAELLSFFEG
jgi:hypothetical protein